MRRNDFGDGLMFDRSPFGLGSTKRRRGEDDRGRRMVDQRERLRGCGKERGDLGRGGVLWRRKREKRPKEEREGED